MLTLEIEWYVIAGRMLLALALGAAIGIEREIDGQDAGLRTHVMLALGCALFALVSVAGFDSFVTDAATNVTVDVTRVAAYVAGGVGFIGGGVILKHGASVAGVTTAASLWSTAAIGVACGIGFWMAAVVTAVLAVVVLGPLQALSRGLANRAAQHRDRDGPAGAGA